MVIPESANRYLAAGLCVLPAIRLQKRPAVGAWRQFRGRLPAESELSAWLARSPDAVCIVCGAVSGNAEMIDFDAHGELFDAWAGQIPPDLLSRLVIERSPSGGYHVFYRCESTVCGNMKLAQRKEGDKIATLIETRGEGGLFLCTPTPGYVPVQGELHAPPLVTEAERDALLTAAWTLNEYLPPVLNGPRFPADKSDIDASASDNSHIRRMPSDISDSGGSPPHSSDNGHVPSDIPHTAPSSSDISDNASSRLDIPHTAPSPPYNPHIAVQGADISHRPGDDFNRRGDVRAILAQAGWALVKPGENEYWRRPGKSSGWSASLKDGVFYVFSANAAPFEPNRAYSPFAVYALLTHNGDYETAARALRTSGYGGDPASDIHPGVDISGIMRMPVAQPATPSHNAHPGPVCDTPVAQGAPAFDLQTFSDTPERQIVWLWPGVIPRGMPSLIAGKQGLGKSFLICDIAARVSTGRPMPDGQPGTPGNVLLLAREDDASCVLLPRLKAAKADLKRVWWSVFANAATGSPFDLAEHIDLLTRTAVERRFDLIVVDTFAAFAPAGTDSNAAQDVRLLLDALTRLARATGAAVVVVAHLRKTGQGDGDPMDAIAGSVQMTAGVRVASMLEKGVADGERWFRVVKSNLGKIDEQGWTWRFAWPDPFTEGAAEMPHLEWATAGNAYHELTAGRTDAGPSAQALRDACLATLDDGPRPQRIAIGQALASLRKTYPRLNRDAVELAMDDLTRDSQAGVETWEGVRGAGMIGLSGTRPESPEDKALRLARENPRLTVRELRALVGCRRDVAMQALREVREASGKEPS